MNTFGVYFEQTWHVCENPFEEILDELGDVHLRDAGKWIGALHYWPLHGIQGGALMDWRNYFSRIPLLIGEYFPTLN